MNEARCRLGGSLRRVAGVLSLLAVGLGSAWTEPARAAPQDVTLAERHAAEAYAAYREQRFAEAVALYRQAYAVVPSADMLYNIARIYDVGLKDRPLAITFYRRYVADPGAEAERIRKANERLAALKEAEAALAESPPPAASAAPARDSSAPAAQEPPPFWTGWRVAAAVVGAAGVVAVGVGSGFGVAALSEAEDVDRHCDGNLCDQRGLDAVSAADGHATIATTGMVVGGALIAAAATIVLVDPGRPIERDSLSGLQWTPLASTSELGVALSGSF